MDADTFFRKQLTIRGPYITWLAVWSQVHLALTHPSNSGPARRIAYDFYRDLTERLVEDGAVEAELAAEALAAVAPAPELSYEA